MSLTAEGCRRRRRRLWQTLPSRTVGDALLLGDPLHLRYLAGFHVDPFSLAGGFGGLLLLRRDGPSTLFIDTRWPLLGTVSAQTGAVHVFLRPGSDRPMLTHVLLPMMMGQPIVRSLKYFQSSGRCHGIAPPMPMTLFSDAAAMRVIIRRWAL